MASTITVPVSARMKPTDVERLRQAAEARQMTLSAFLAAIAREALKRRS